MSRLCGGLISQVSKVKVEYYGPGIRAEKNSLSMESNPGRLHAKQACYHRTIKSSVKQVDNVIMNLFCASQGPI